MTNSTTSFAGRFEDDRNVEWHSVPVDYDLAVEDAVAASGCQPLDPITRKHLRSKRTGKADLEITLVRFDDVEVMDSVDVLLALEKKGLRGIDLRELLAFAEKYRDAEDWGVTVVAMGSVWYGKHRQRHMSELGHRHGRDLGHFWFDEVKFEPRCRFAAVRK